MTACIGQYETPVEFDAAFEQSYPELRALARARLRWRPHGGSLGTTSLVHESYLRCARLCARTTTDRQRFFAYASQVMRSVIVDFARQRAALRRGGNARHDSFLDEDAPALQGEQEILRLHEALLRLGQAEPRLTQVVQMRYFAGMSEAEIADVLGIGERTVKRDWQRARVLLAEAMHV
jgi:RNA polymerase sigma factor (TIGR02999 family)